MTIAQVKAARRKFRRHYGKPVIGQPHYKKKSESRMVRQEQRLREKQKAMQSRPKKG